MSLQRVFHSSEVINEKNNVTADLLIVVHFKFECLIQI